MNVKNTWIGTGRIANDLEIKVTESGKKVLNFNVAIDDGTKEKPHATFVPVEAWENLAETIEKYFKKGDQIIAGGRVAVRKVIDRGENRYSVRIILESFEWGAKKREENKQENSYKINYDPNELANEGFGGDEPW